MDCSNFAQLGDKKDEYFTIHVNGSIKVSPEKEGEILRHLIKLVSEAVLASSRKNQIIILYLHLDQFKIENVRKAFVINMVKSFQLMFPEALYKCYMCNSPSIFSCIYEIISSCLDNRTREKLEFIKA
jgi:arginine decarboxylase-like protein